MRNISIFTNFLLADFKASPRRLFYAQYSEFTLFDRKCLSIVKDHLELVVLIDRPKPLCGCLESSLSRKKFGNEDYRLVSAQKTSGMAIVYRGLGFMVKR